MSNRPLNILHISPTYFHENSILGGAERYVDSLCEAQAKLGHKITLLSFSHLPAREYLNGYERIVLPSLTELHGNKANPIEFSFLRYFPFADIIHLHQAHTVLTEISCLFAKLLGKKLILTDHGGGGRTYLTRLKVQNFVNSIQTVSQYSSKTLEKFNVPKIEIFGGVDPKKFPLTNFEGENNQFSIIGRILPHKGHHHLIKAITNQKLNIIGRVGNQNYLNHLKELSKGKDIQFFHDLNDEEMLKKINLSKAGIYPSTFIDHNGNKVIGEPELFGIAPVEMLATGRFSLCSDTGSYPEVTFSKDFSFQDGNIDELGQKLNQLESFELTKEKQNDLRSFVLDRFTWEKVAQRSLKNYYDLLGNND